MGWPIPGFFTGFSTQGQLRQAHDDVLARARMDIGGDSVQNLTILSGLIVPTKGAVRLYGEAASADTVEAIDVNAYDDGQLIELRIGDENGPITVQHAASPAANQIRIRDGFNLLMSSLTQRLVLERTGNFWTDTERRGRELRRIIGATGQPPFATGWESHPSETWQSSFWKDEEGNVSMTGRARRLSGASQYDEVVQLPVGYRPAYQVRVPTRISNAGTAEISEGYVAGDGRVFFGRLAGAPTGSVDIYLDAFRFRAEA